MSQDDDNIQAIRAQMRKVRITWARIGQVLQSKNVSPFCRCQVIPGNNSSHPPLWQQIVGHFLDRNGTARRIPHSRRYRMAKKNKLKRGPNWERIYPRLEDMLNECGMMTMEEYILIHRQTIAVYVATRPILDKCRQGKQ